VPFPAATLLTSTPTATLVPGCQEVAGRQCASLLLIQFQDPACCGVDVTVIRFSKVALSFTGTSKWTMTGMATPTVEP